MNVICITMKERNINGNICIELSFSWLFHLTRGFFISMKTMPKIFLKFSQKKTFIVRNVSRLKKYFELKGANDNAPYMLNFVKISSVAKKSQGNISTL